MAPLSAALANGDDTLSITADCYSTAGTDAAITAALLAYYTSSQVDTLLGDYRTGTAQDKETASAITAALLAYYTFSQVDALLGDYRTASAGHADAGGHRWPTGRARTRTCSPPTKSPRRWWRTAQPQTRTRYYTIAQVDGLLAGKRGGPGPANSCALSGRRRGRRW